MLKEIKIIFYPSIRRLIIPVLILIILTAVSIFNILKMPELGETLYYFEESYEKVRYARLNLSNDINPFFDINYDSEEVAYLHSLAGKKLDRANVINIFAVAPDININKIYPLWPVPCSLNSYAVNCAHYINEDTYNKFYKISEYRSEIISDEINLNFMGTKIVLKEYRKISPIFLFIHIFVFSSIVYFFVCLLFYLHDLVLVKVKEKK